MKVRKQWNPISFAERKIAAVKFELHIQQKLFFKDEGEIKEFSGKENLKEFLSNRYALQEMLQKSSLYRNKITPHRNTIWQEEMKKHQKE